MTFIYPNGFTDHYRDEDGTPIHQPRLAPVTLPMPYDYPIHRDSIVLDFETYYDPASGYTLKNPKLSTVEYVQHDLFEILSVSICITRSGVQQPPFTVTGHYEVIDYLQRSFDQEMIYIWQNGQFDGLIMSYHMGIIPPWCLDTMATAAFAFGSAIRANRKMSQGILALDNLSRFLRDELQFPIPEKYKGAYDNFAGKRLAMLTTQELQDVCRTGETDVLITDAVFKASMTGCNSLAYYATQKYLHGYLAMPFKMDKSALGQVLTAYRIERDRRFKETNAILDAHPDHPATQQILWWMYNGLNELETAKLIKWREALGVDFWACSVRRYGEQYKVQGALLLSYIKKLIADGATVAPVGMAFDLKMLRGKEYSKLIRLCGKEVPMGKNAKGDITEQCNKKEPKFIVMAADKNDPVLATLAGLRLDYMGSITETRPVRYLGIADSGYGAGAFAIVAFGALNTSRCSGTSASGGNTQNLSKKKLACADGEKRNIRAGFSTWGGWMMTAPDLSQVEMRMVLAMSGDWERVHAMANGMCPYTMLADEMQPDMTYGYIKTLAKLDIAELSVSDQEAIASKFGFLSTELSTRAYDAAEARQLGKVSCLLLQYGASWKIFIKTAFTWGVKIDEETGQFAHRFFAKSNPKITAQWRLFDSYIQKIYNAQRNHHELFERHPNIPEIIITHDGVRLPHGFMVRLPQLRKTGRRFEYKRDGEWYSIYGASLMQSCCQGTVSGVIEENSNTIYRDYGSIVCGSVHDETVAIVPQDNPQPYLDRFAWMLSRTPAFLPDAVVLDADGAYSDNYQGCK